MGAATALPPRGGDDGRPGARRHCVGRRVAVASRGRGRRPPRRRRPRRRRRPLPPLPCACSASSWLTDDALWPGVGAARRPAFRRRRRRLERVARRGARRRWCRSRGDHSGLEKSLTLSPTKKPFLEGHRRDPRRRGSRPPPRLGSSECRAAAAALASRRVAQQRGERSGAGRLRVSASRVLCTPRRSARSAPPSARVLAVAVLLRASSRGAARHRASASAASASARASASAAAAPSSSSAAPSSSGFAAACPRTFAARAEHLRRQSMLLLERDPLLLLRQGVERQADPRPQRWPALATSAALALASGTAPTIAWTIRKLRGGAAKPCSAPPRLLGLGSGT